jgi:aspartate aminotransferase
MLSKKANNITPSITLAISSKFKEMKAAGEDVVGFGAGEPDFDTPENIKEAAKKAIDEGFTKYTPVSGTIELKKAICEKFKRENDINYSIEEVIVSNGGKQILSNIMKAVLNEGDEVIIPSPYWVSYPEEVKLAGGVPVFCETDDLKVTAELIEKKISEKTKILIINSPSNPSGAVCSREELEKIAKLVVEKEILVISDEVYEHFIYDGKEHCSIASFGDEIRKRTLTVNAVSKTYSMTGWRIGYCGGSKEIINAMSAIQSHEASNPCSIAQKAAVEALNGSQESVKEMKNEFELRRKILVDGLNEIEGIKCEMPEGSFYAFPNISGTGMKSMEFAEKFLEEKKVAVIPGISFGFDYNIRLSYAVSIEDIKKGLERINEFMEGLN